MNGFPLAAIGLTLASVPCPGALPAPAQIAVTARQCASDATDTWPPHSYGIPCELPGKGRVFS